MTIRFSIIESSMIRQVGIWHFHLTIFAVRGPESPKNWQLHQFPSGLLRSLGVQWRFLRLSASSR